MYKESIRGRQNGNPGPDIIPDNPVVNFHMRPENKQRLDLRRKVADAYSEARGQWTGCNWSTEWGQCKIDLKDVSQKQAQDLAERYAAITDGERPRDDELRQLRRAAKFLNPTGEGEFSPAQVAAVLAADYEGAVDWLHSVEADAAEAEELAEQVIGNIIVARHTRNDELFLKARSLAEQLRTFDLKYAGDTRTWSAFCDAVTEYLEPEPLAGR